MNMPAEQVGRKGANYNEIDKLVARRLLDTDTARRLLVVRLGKQVSFAVFIEQDDSDGDLDDRI